MTDALLINVEALGQQRGAGQLGCDGKGQGAGTESGWANAEAGCAKAAGLGGVDHFNLPGRCFYWPEKACCFGGTRTA
ncbi:hypothetical protein GCM10022265_16440 [Marinobacter xestospongiae]